GGEGGEAGWWGDAHLPPGTAMDCGAAPALYENSSTNRGSRETSSTASAIASAARTRTVGFVCHRGATCHAPMEIRRLGASRLAMSRRSNATPTAAPLPTTAPATTESNRLAPPKSSIGPSQTEATNENGAPRESANSRVMLSASSVL